MSANEEKIMAFWQWFVKSESIIKDCIENETEKTREHVVEQLNNLILNIGAFSWDIGLDGSNSWFLTISPNSDKDQFKVSKEIMEYAPTHMNWTFHSSKPAKNWDRIFKIHNHNLDLVNIDANPWNYIVFEEGDGQLELIFEANNITHIDEETALSAAHEFVTHELGEALKIKRIASVKIVVLLESEYDDSKEPISELKDHLTE